MELCKIGFVKTMLLLEIDKLGVGHCDSLGGEFENKIRKQQTRFLFRITDILEWAEETRIIATSNEPTKLILKIEEGIVYDHEGAYAFTPLYEVYEKVVLGNTWVEI